MNLGDYQIKKSWIGMIMVENHLISCEWTVDIDLQCTEDQDPDFVETALMRINVLFDEQIPGSLFISQNNPLIELDQNISVRLIEFPEEPFDQLILAVLAKKIHSITRGVFSVRTMSIENSLAGGLRVSVDSYVIDDLISALEEPNAWYISESPEVTFRENSATRINDWSQVSLEWDNETKNIEETTPPRGHRNWKPSVIKSEE